MALMEVTYGAVLAACARGNQVDKVRISQSRLFVGQKDGVQMMG